MVKEKKKKKKKKSHSGRSMTVATILNKSDCNTISFLMLTSFPFSVSMPPKKSSGVAAVLATRIPRCKTR